MNTNGKTETENNNGRETGDQTVDKTSSNQIQSLAESIAKLREELAEHRPVSELIRYLLYFWAAISLVIGFFGWKELSHLDDVVEQKVKLQFPRDCARYTDYLKIIEETKALYADFERLTAAYRERVDDLKRFEQITADFDIEGQVLALSEEARRRQHKGANEENRGDQQSDDEPLLDPRWRREAILTIERFQRSLATKNCPADFIFNAAQLCRMLKQFDLAEKLTEAAHGKDASSPIEAMYLSSQVQTSTAEKREKAFTSLMTMIVDLPDYSPEIVLAEAWNAAEDQRRYSELIEAIDRLVENRLSSDGASPVPSYAYIIKAQALLRRSHPGCVSAAQLCIDSADRSLAEESAMSQWFDSTLKERAEVELLLAKSRVLSSIAGQPSHE